MKKVYVFLSARNEAENLPKFFDSILSQTLKPSKILLINDGSTDETEEIAKSYHVDIVTLPYHHESYVSRAELNWKLAEVFNHAFPPPKGYEYMMQAAPDVILPNNYIEWLTEKMHADPKLVIASGQIEGEPTHTSHARGAGRIYKVCFWNRFIKKYPLNYTFESYPIYKALSLGYKVRSFPELKMKAQRPTHIFKASYGYAMRELGYSPIHAIGRCLRASIREPKTGAKMLITYTRPPLHEKVDKDVKNWVRLNQIKRILHLRSMRKG